METLLKQGDAHQVQHSCLQTVLSIKIPSSEHQFEKR